MNPAPPQPPAVPFRQARSRRTAERIVAAALGLLSAKRIEEISGALAIRGAVPQRELTDRERETLKVLGYVE